RRERSIRRHPSRRNAPEKLWLLPRAVTFILLARANRIAAATSFADVAATIASGFRRSATRLFPVIERRSASYPAADFDVNGSEVERLPASTDGCSAALAAKGIRDRRKPPIAVSVSRRVKLQLRIRFLPCHSRMSRSLLRGSIADKLKTRSLREPLRV